ncbi:hypothetical protein [Xanthomonas sp. SHU 199]|uniref:hypothetical protein n=1 Tax=Xanthomonas sp. SHU 199 TaxID=1591174 RepID=UPI0012FE8B53|nr:hypothetical protein [Xanthomonas sp. SHU 199]
MKVKDIDFFFKDGLWTAIISGKKFDLEMVSDYKAVVKILEHDFSEVSDALGKYFKYKYVVLSALDFDSVYWDALALRWLESGNVGLDEDICVALKKKLDHGWFNQHNRHVALKLLKRIGL